jgi:hypothetical protein
LLAGGGEFQCRLIIRFRQGLRRQKRAGETNGDRYARIKESTKGIFSSRMILDPSHCCSLETLKPCIGTRKESLLNHLVKNQVMAEQNAYRDDSLSVRLFEGDMFDAEQIGP